MVVVPGPRSNCYQHEINTSQAQITKKNYNNNKNNVEKNGTFGN